MDGNTINIICILFLCFFLFPENVDTRGRSCPSKDCDSLLCKGRHYYLKSNYPLLISMQVRLNLNAYSFIKLS